MTTFMVVVSAHAAFARKPKPREAEVAGPNPARSTTNGPGKKSVKEKIFNTIWKLKKDGYADTTLEGYSRKLRMLANAVNLDHPEAVKGYIASKEWNNAYKEKIVDAYEHYVRANGLLWSKPIYKRTQKLPYIATTEQLNKIIAHASRKYALILSVFRDTGMRPIEVHNLTSKSIDLEKGTINIESAKFGNPRCLRLKTSTLAMLKEHITRSNFGINDKMFPTPNAMRHTFDRTKKKVAQKLHEPALLKIRLYDFRHHYATMLYHKPKTSCMLRNS